MAQISEKNVAYNKSKTMDDMKDKKSGYTLLSEDFLRVNEENDKIRQ